MTLKIIGAGMPRTGTMSLKVALEKLGYAQCYHMVDLMQHLPQVADWWAVSEGQAIDWEALFAGYQAIVDIPGQRYYQALMQVYPQAKVILTTRDPEQWYESLRQTIYEAHSREAVEAAWWWLRYPLSPQRRNKVKLGQLIGKILWQDYFENRFADKAFAINVYEKHIQEVQQYVPADKLLVFAVAEGWQPLCDFLGMSIPKETPFPHVNDRQYFQQFWQTADLPPDDSANASRQIFQPCAGDRPAIIFDQQAISYQDLQHHSQQIAHRLLRSGLKSGERVALYLPNCPEFVSSYLAVHQAGGVVVTINTALTGAEVDHILADSQVKMVITSAESQAKISAGELPQLEQILLIDGPPHTPQTLPIRSDKPVAGFEPICLSGDDPAVILYSSGTTGQPKGAVLSHGNLLTTARLVAEQLALNSSDRVLLFLPIFHSFALTTILNPALYSQATIVLLPEFEAEAVLQAVVTQQITTFFGVPTIYTLLLDQATPEQLVSVKRYISAGATLPLEIAQRWQEKFGRLINEGLGFTEGSLVTFNQRPLEKHGAVGLPLPGIAIEVMDESGYHLEPGNVGEIAVRGPNIMLGYWNQPEQTSEATREGWFHTGDMGRFDEDGYLYIVDRRKDMVNVGGEKVYPTEVEQILYRHPAVAEVAVYGVPHAVLGEEVRASIVLKEDQTATEDEMIDFCRESLAHFKLPSVVEFVESLPKNKTGKILKRLLRERFEAGGSQDESQMGFYQKLMQTESATEQRTLLRQFVKSEIRRIVGLEPGDDQRFFDLGLDSLMSIQLGIRLGTGLHLSLPAMVILQYPTLDSLSRFLLDQFKQQASRTAVALPQVKPDPVSQYEPFPLSDIQQAYWIGRQSHLELGNLATQLYLEWRIPELDVPRLQAAWHRVMAHHPMLRTVIQAVGQQRTLADWPTYQISSLDLRQAETKTAQQRLAEIRQMMIGHIAQADEWPLFDIRVTLTPDGAHLHFCIDMLVVDAWSIELILQDWAELYDQPEMDLPPLDLTFRDYMMTAKAFEANSALYEASKSYWLNRLDSLPAAPKLPFAQDPQAIEVPQFQGIEKRLAAPLWEAIKAKAAQYELQPATVLLAVYAEVLTLWSKSAHFSLNQTFFHRLPLHPQVNQVVGDFTSAILTEIDNRSEASFIQRAKQIQAQLWQDLDHRYFSGVQVIRALNRQRREGNVALMPVIFTNLLAVKSTSRTRWGELVHRIGQTSQVYLDHVVREADGELILYWNVVEGLFPADLLADMFAGQVQFLNRLAAEETAWTERQPLTLPAKQLAQRLAVNDTQAPISEALLHTLFIEQAQQTPDNIAVIDLETTLTYRALYQQATHIGHWLRERGAKPNQLVAVVMEKGWEQVAAVLGVLMAGAAYLPVDPEQPPERQHYLLAQGEARLALTQPHLENQLVWPETVQRFVVDKESRSDLSPLDIRQTPTDLAYVIYTSGSTGRPKGVVIDHRGAVNTVLDINRRFGVTAQDRVLALSALNFDLSVYDIFGLLAVGGTIVMPAPEGRRDPAHWAELMTRHGVTLWDTVPALMQMLVEYQAGRALNAPLRLVMMSGDWIPIDLPDRIRQLWPEATLMSLGGATEASIWSIYYSIERVEPTWNSIPYGKPLTNQTFQVLNERLDPCPVWVPGQLYIGGIGLALGYWRDEEKTRASFFTHPRTGERLYKTGDLGRYLPDGNIEFLGREDFQVKIRGHRIELGEIEANLLKHPAVKEVIVSAVGDTRHDKQLVAYIVPTENGHHPPETQPIDQAAYGLQVMQGVLTDSFERLQFKLKQPGIRQFKNGLSEVVLPAADIDETAYLARQSYRQFLAEPITLTQLGRLLSCLSQRTFPQGVLPKYRYASAGSLYPVQTYLYIKPDRVTDLAGGFYYYHPLNHRLVLLSSTAAINRERHGDTNQVIFDQSAFSLFLVAEYQAIEPMYGATARDFCLLEAGYMSQLLMMEAPEQDMGLCPIGGMDFEPLRAEFGLGESQEMIHSFLGGGIAAEQKAWWPQTTPQAESWEEGLKVYLSQKLPGYMVPPVYVQLSEIPLTANGKVDRKALPRPDLSKQTIEFVPPTNDLERRLIELVQKSLAVETLGLTDDFFDWGADSLDIVHLHNEIKAEFQRDIKMTDIFDHPTVQMLAELISQAPATITAPAPPTGPLPSPELSPERVALLSTNVDNLTEAEVEQLLTHLR